MATKVPMIHFQCSRPKIFTGQMNSRVNSDSCGLYGRKTPRPGIVVISSFLGGMQNHFFHHSLSDANILDQANDQAQR